MGLEVYVSNSYFDKGRHHRTPSESVWGRLKHNPHAMIVEVGGVVKTTPQLSPRTRGLESYDFFANLVSNRRPLGQSKFKQ